jgi:hypothetical protein
VLLEKAVPNQNCAVNEKMTSTNNLKGGVQRNTNSFITDASA